MKESQKLNFSEELIQRLALQLFFRKPAPWTGLEARRITALTHKVLGITTRPAQFRVLVGAVFRVGRYVEPVSSLRRVLVSDWRTVQLAVMALLESVTDDELVDRFLTRVKERIADYASDEFMAVDWVEVTNKILCEFGSKLDNIDLPSKLRMADAIVTLLEQRREELANDAAEEQGISIDELMVSLTDAIADVNSSRHLEGRSVGEEKYARNETKQDNVEEILARSDPRSEPAIREVISALPDTVAKIAIRRWKEIERDSLAEKLWTKSILGTSGTIRELKVISQGVHYRLLYKSDKQCTRPFLVFGLRRDLKDLVEKSKALV